MRCPSSPFQGTRSRPSIFLPNFTHVTVCAPGWLGAATADFRGSQLSSAIFASHRNNQRPSSFSKHTALRGKFLATLGGAEWLARKRENMERGVQNLLNSVYSAKKS